MKRTKAQIMDGVECIESKVIANNTVRYWTDDGREIIRLHLTDIVTKYTDGCYVLNSGGWQTLTTKERMNRFSPCHIWQKNRVWYVNYNGETVPYKDGITLYPDGKIDGAGDNPKKVIRLKKKCQKYARNYVKALMSGKVSQPSNGDCWYCLMFEKNGHKSADHIKSHIERKYYVPSLLVNAVNEFPVGDAIRYQLNEWMDGNKSDGGWLNDIAKEQATKAIARHCMRRLGLVA